MNPRAVLSEASRTWRPPQELLRSRPRETELTLAGRMLACLAIALFAGGLVAGVLINLKAVRDQENRQLLLNQGKRTWALVTRRWMTGGKDPVFRVEIAYQAGDEDLRKTARIGQTRWRNLQQGASLEICYLPEDPGRFLILGEASQQTPRWLSFLVAGISAGCGWLVMRRLGTQRRLLSEGRPALGVVTAHKATKDGKIFRYSFATLGGSIVSGKSAPTRNPPPVGTFQCILYEPDKVKHNETYPLKFVRMSHHN